MRGAAYPPAWSGPPVIVRSPLRPGLASSDTLPANSRDAGSASPHHHFGSGGVMSRRFTGAVALALLALLVAAVPSHASSGINVYRFKAKPKTVEKLALAGFDMSEARRL